MNIIITENQLSKIINEENASPCPQGKKIDALITVDDILGGKTISKGYCNPSPESAIVKIQKKLQNLKYFNWTGSLGYYGDETANAISKFYSGLSCKRQVDGSMIGKNVIESLNNPDRYNRYHSNIDIVAATLWGEARGESREGQIAIYNILKNRAKKEGSASLKQMAGECLRPYQFSYWNGKGFLKDPKCAKGSLGVSPSELEEFKTLINSNPPNNIGEATHYVNKKHATTANKWWEDSSKFQLVKKIGSHEFYKEL